MVNTVPQRILIVRLSAIGDTILSVPVLNALRQSYPDAKIAWVTEKASSQLIQGHAALDQLFVTDKRAFKSLRQFWRLAKSIRQWQPDLTIDLQGLTKSALLSWFSGAGRRIGFERDVFDGRELSTYLNNQCLRPSSKHMIDRGLELLHLLGVQASQVSFDLPETESEIEFAETTVRKLELTNRFAILNVGAGWPSKIWPSARYADVANHLWEHWGLNSLVVWSGEQEHAAALEVVSRTNGNAMLAPATNLVQLRGLIRRAILFVGSDTGPMHLSVALGTPTVGMIGPMPIERVGPYGPNHVGVQVERLGESQSSERKSNRLPMLSILPSHVIVGVDQLMRKSMDSPGAIQRAA